MILAQVVQEAATMEGLFVEILKVGGAPAVTLGLLWYLLTKNIPATQERFHSELREERGMFRNELQAHREESKMQRQTFESSVKNITDTMNGHHNDLKLTLRDIQNARPIT
jgi:hypothetical protein